MNILRYTSKIQKFHGLMLIITGITVLTVKQFLLKKLFPDQAFVFTCYDIMTKLISD